MAKKAGKISKKDAGYTLGAPHCDICKHFIEDEGKEEAGAEDYGECELVEGPIDEDMVCRLYEPGQEARETLAGGSMPKGKYK